MIIKFARFNIYLCAIGLALLGLSCASGKKKKEMSVLELHLEVNKDGASDNETVPIFRDNPVYVNVDKEPFLDSTDMTEATVVPDMGGFAIRIKFNERGKMLLNSITAANHGHRIGIFCSFGQTRWLAAPLIRNQIADGMLYFTPDASREESDTIVKGLNNAAEELAKKDKF